MTYQSHSCNDKSQNGDTVLYVVTCELGFLSSIQNRAGIFKLCRSPGIDSASLCGLAGRYDNPFPFRFLAFIDRSKIPPIFGKIFMNIGSEGGGALSEGGVGCSVTASAKADFTAESRAGDLAKDGVGLGM
jgi:hypothetical protein